MASAGEGYTFTAIYDKINKNYSTDVRERLLYILFTDPRSNTDVKDFRSEVYDDNFEQYYSAIRNMALKDQLANRLLLKKGMQVFDFSLPDSTGKIIKISNLKGKVLLLDFWSTGCTGCANFSQFFHKTVYPEFADCKDFLVIKVNVDKDKGRWIKSIQSGIYTNPGDMNLYTAGLGLSHPLIMHYRIQSYPLILLIDRDLKIHTNIKVSTSSAELSKLIKTVLN